MLDSPIRYMMVRRVGAVGSVLMCSWLHASIFAVIYHISQSMHEVGKEAIVSKSGV